MPPTLPPPPPAGIHTPTDDWTDDPSFDLSLTSSLAQGILLPASPTSSNPHSRSYSHSSSTSSRGSGGMMGSPLRQIHTSKPVIGKSLKSRAGIQEEAEDDGFDFPEDLEVDDGVQGGTLKRLSVQSMPGRIGGTGGRGTSLGNDGGADAVDFPDDLTVDEGDFQSGTLKAAAAVPSKPARKGMGTIGLSGTVIGVGPKGVGTITRLGRPAKTSHPAESAKSSRAPDFDMDELEDLFDGAGPSTFSLPSTRLPSLNKSSGGLSFPLSLSNRVIAPSNALDDLDFDFDDELNDANMGEEEDQATLKAGATIKALLPPPRPKTSSHSSSTPKPSTRHAPEEEADMDLVLPLSMTNLTLAAASSRAQSSSSAKLLKPRASTSTIRSDWDSPSSSSAPGSASKGMWDDGPWGKRPRASETSTTSISEDIGTPHRKGRAVEVEVEGEEEGEDMMMGLVLPELGFFEGRREGELNRILDQKRKPQEAFVSAGQERRGWGKRNGPEEKGGLDESMEDGLLFDDPGKELTGHRLRQQKKVRGMAGGTIKKSSAGKDGGRVSAAVGSWEKARESGWGRHTPLPVVSKERDGRGSGGLGLSGTGVGVGHRSHSATAAGVIAASSHHNITPGNRDFSSASAMAGFSSTPHRHADPSHPPSSRRDIDRHAQDKEASTRSRTQSMAPPPTLPPIPPTTPSSRLRHQKSHYQIPPSPSPTLARKQSLSSLQDTSIHPHTSSSEAGSGSRADPPASTPQKERYHSSTSRLTMGTSSSRAKARPPISAIFPRSEIHSTPSHGSGGMYANHSASSSSNSISGLARGHNSGHRSRQVPVPVQSQMVVPLGGRRRGLTSSGDKKRTWGDGTELEGIEDLEVEEPSTRAGSGMGSGIGLGKPSRKGDSLGRSTIPPPKSVPESETRKKSNGGSMSKRRPRKAAGLIKHLGTVDKKKVVGDMTWNPASLRWEGNESILRDFESPSGTPTSSSGPTRPALITHYTGGVVPLPTSSSSHSASGLGSGHSLTASTIRIVGDMQFDPERMCWVSLGDEEPDPFADMADDEDDEGGGATITRASGRKLVSVGTGLGVSAGSGWSSRLASESSAGGSVMSWEERVRVREADREEESGEGIVSEELWRECKDAEERHRKEMKGWGLGRSDQMGREERRDRERREERRLWEIRYLAMKS